MAGYRLTLTAEQDLTGIWDYTFETWGADQADRYLSQLETCFEHVATGRAVCRDFREIDAQLKSHHCQHHFIFFLVNDGTAIIIAVLHERMDLMRRLGDRLK